MDTRFGGSTEPVLEGESLAKQPSTISFFYPSTFLSYLPARATCLHRLLCRTFLQSDRCFCMNIPAPGVGVDREIHRIFRHV